MASFNLLQYSFILQAHTKKRKIGKVSKAVDLVEASFWLPQDLTLQTQSSGCNAVCACAPPRLMNACYSASHTESDVRPWGVGGAPPVRRSIICCSICAVKTHSFLPRVWLKHRRAALAASAVGSEISSSFFSFFFLILRGSSRK